MIVCGICRGVDKKQISKWKTELKTTQILHKNKACSKGLLGFDFNGKLYSGMPYFTSNFLLESHASGSSSAACFIRSSLMKEDLWRFLLSPLIVVYFPISGKDDDDKEKLGKCSQAKMKIDKMLLLGHLLSISPHLK